MINQNINRGVTQPLSRTGTTPIAPPATQPLNNTGKPGLLSKALGFTKDVFIGGGEAILDMGKGLVNTVLHPIQTVKGLAYVATHPAALFHAFVDPYTEAIKSGHPGKALGRGIVEIGSLFVGPQEVVGAAKSVANFFKGTSKAAGSAAAIASIAGDSATVATKLATEATAVESKAGLLMKAGHAAEAAKMTQYASILTKSSDIAKAGNVARALKWANVAANAGTIKVAGKVMNMAGFLATSDKLIFAATRLGKVASFAEKAFDTVTGGKASTTGDVLKSAGQFVVNNPLTLISPPLGIAVALGKMSKLPEGIDPQSLTPELAQKLANQYNLKNDLENVKAFLGEVGTYKGEAIGPDTGSAEEIKQLQALLRTVGYDIQATGSWNDETAASIIDFKKKNGIHQGYQLKNGEQAINEYVDHATAEVLYQKAQALAGGAQPKTVDDQVKQTAAQYGLEATPDNVNAFRTEIATYQQGVTGPDSDPAAIKALQGELKRIGYPVAENGQFDDPTAEAVIDFKNRQGIHQNYKLADGQYAVNEYADGKTLDAIKQAKSA